MTVGWRYLQAVLVVALATAIALLVRWMFAAPDLVMFFFLAILVAASAGRGPALLASALSVATYDFMFVPPYHTLAIAQAKHILSFVMMFAVGLLVSTLNERLRRQASLTRTEEMRSSLLSAVSHDLRTPLATITGAATSLRDDDLDDPSERRELVALICEEAERLERLVSNLLEMTRIGAGFELKREWVPLEEIVGAALARLEARLAGRQVTIDLPADLPLVSVDPVLLGQVFLNLVDNAIKHAPGPIELRARANPTGIVVEISDRGPGLPEGAGDRIFEKFFQGKGASGAGLGLAISRSIVEAHRGVLRAEDREGGGAVFRFTVPLMAGAPTLPREDERSS